MVLAVSDLVLALVVAGATAIGAAIGGAIAGVVTLKAEAKRLAFSQQLEERRSEEAAAARLAELRVAVRLVQDELILASSWIKHVLEVGEVSPVDLPRESWHAHREPLARLLPTDTWLKVAGAFAGFVIFGPDIERGKVDVAHLADFLEDVEAATDALTPYAAAANLSLDVDCPPIRAADKAGRPPPKEP
jgi:hypothetical protein